MWITGFFCRKLTLNLPFKSTCTCICIVPIFFFHSGLQSGVIAASQPYGLPLNETIMPQFFQKLGYRRHMVGKVGLLTVTFKWCENEHWRCWFFKAVLKLSPPQWHLGFHKKEFTPMYRGFETHYGYYLGCGDYYDHTSEANEVNIIKRNISA